MAARFRGGPGSSRNGAAIRLLLRGPSAWIRAIQAENLAGGTTSGMMFAARSEHAETACRVALVRRASASHRPRGLRCQALVLVVPEGALLSKEAGQPLAPAGPVLELQQLAVGVAGVMDDDRVGGGGERVVQLGELTALLVLNLYGTRLLEWGE